MHNSHAGAAAPRRVTARTRLTLYRTLRRFTGAALAYRLAFAGRAEA
ncbi:hypothetical protein [Zoogloea sp.]